jgi:phospholipase/carboxylesterase
VSPAALVVQRPAGQARQLFLLFHDEGGSPGDLAAMGRVLAGAFPQAVVASLSLPPDARELVAVVARWQGECGLDAQATALVGHAAGATLVLESTKCTPAQAGRVVALAGTFAEMPEQAAPGVTIHLFHGKEDPVTPYGRVVAAAERLIALGTDVTADILPFAGRAVTPEMGDLVLERLRGYIPRRRWQEALAADPGDPQRTETRPH